jgi:predicted phosphodiesterase
MVADPHTPIIGSERARRTIQWARSKISNDNRHYLKTLPITHSVNEAILLVHGSLVPEPNFSRYLVSIADASKNFEVIQKASPTPRMILFGHTHIPEIFQLREGVVSRRPEEIVNLYSDGTYLINPGSVGLSRNGDPRASYAVLDTDASTVTIHRVEFDSQSVEALASIHRALRSSLPEDAITPHLRRLLNIGKKLLRSLGLSKML